MKIFRKSPIKNALLQEKVTKSSQKPLNLLLDVRTRWNSTEAMIERFLQIWECVKEALAELGQQDLLTNKDVEVLRSLLNTLQPIRLASEALGRCDATLLTAEGSLSFLFNKLKKLDTPISREMYEALLKRIGERRNKELVSVLKFLNNRNLSATSELPVLSKVQLHKFIRDEARNLIKTAQVQEKSTRDDNSSDQEPSTLTLEQELESAIHEYAETSTSAIEPVEISKVMQKEITLFELNGQLSNNLKQLLENLKTIKPTSTDSERVFSVSAAICNKTRSRLSDKSINVLCFLKYYFKRIDKNM